MKERGKKRQKLLDEMLDELWILDEPSGDGADDSREKSYVKILGSFLYVIACTLEKIAYITAAFLGFEIGRWLGSMFFG